MHCTRNSLIKKMNSTICEVATDLYVKSQRKKN